MKHIGYFISRDDENLIYSEAEDRWSWSSSIQPTLVSIEIYEIWKLVEHAESRAVARKVFVEE